LSLYVWDRDRHLKQDKPIGKIAIRREDLHVYNNKDHWFALRPVDEDSEVQGMAHVEVVIQDEGNFLTTTSTSSTPTMQSTVYESNSLPETKENFTNDINNITKLAKIKHSQSTSSTLNKKTTVVSPEHVEDLYRKKRTYFDNQKSCISIKLLECVDLTRKNGACDPYAVISCYYTNKRKITKRTKVQKKTVSPEFQEIFYFDMTVDTTNENPRDSNNVYTVVPFGVADLFEITVTFWHSSSGMAGEDLFLGEIKLPVRGRQQQNALQARAWYFLQPRSCTSAAARSCATPPGTRLSSSDANSMGSLRLNLHYIAENVFPLATYDSLYNILLQSIDQTPITSSAVYLLGVKVNKNEIAQPLVRLFTHKNLIATIIKNLADHEISKLTDPTTIFRGNTLVSKMMDEAMRLIGLHYLHNTLRPIVEEILSDKKPCEIDPTKANDKTDIETNLNNLQDYVEKVFEAITKSAVKCPTILCQIFHDLRECAAKYFPMNKEVRYSVVSGFIFLRFFAPAILGPKLFDLTTEQVVSNMIVLFENNSTDFSFSHTGYTNKSYLNINIKNNTISWQFS
jgi:Ras GTPase-activating protein 3